jgi:glycerate kinase
VAVAGRCTLDPDRLARHHIGAVHTLTDLEPDPRRCIADAGPLLERAGEAIARDHSSTAAGTR